MGTYVAVGCALFFSYTHLPIVEHPADIVIQRRSLLVERLRENINLVLEMSPLLADLLVLQASIVLDFLPQLRACCAEEIRFLPLLLAQLLSVKMFRKHPRAKTHILNIALANKTLLCHIQVLRQQRPNPLHSLNRLRGRIAPVLQLLDHAITIEVMHIRRRTHARMCHSLLRRLLTENLVQRTLASRLLFTVRPCRGNFREERLGVLPLEVLDSGGLKGPLVFGFDYAAGRVGVLFGRFRCCWLCGWGRRLAVGCWLGFDGFADTGGERDVPSSLAELPGLYLLDGRYWGSAEVVGLVSCRGVESSPAQNGELAPRCGHCRCDAQP